MPLRNHGPALSSLCSRGYCLAPPHHGSFPFFLLILNRPRFSPHGRVLVAREKPLRFLYCPRVPLYFFVTSVQGPRRLFFLHIECHKRSIFFFFSRDERTFFLFTTALSAGGRRSFPGPHLFLCPGNGLSFSSFFDIGPIFPSNLSLPIFPYRSSFYALFSGTCSLAPLTFPDPHLLLFLLLSPRRAARPPLLRVRTRISSPSSPPALGQPAFAPRQTPRAGFFPSRSRSASLSFLSPPS